MITNTFKILFVISATRINRKGLVPLICRMTYQGKRKPFSTGLFINPNYWNSNKQKAHPPNDENNFTNTQLSLIKQKINQAFLFLQVNAESFDVVDIYLTYKGENVKKQRTLLEVLELNNKRMEKLIGKGYASKYVQKYKGMYILLQGFIKKTYKKNDVLLNSLTMKFLDDLDFYMKSEKNHKQITINKCIQRLRKIIRLAISESYLDKDPFVFYKPKMYSKEIVYLTPEELANVENHKFS